jgi:hypothetical protein
MARAPFEAFPSLPAVLPVPRGESCLLAVTRFLVDPEIFAFSLGFELLAEFLASWER